LLHLRDDFLLLFFPGDVLAASSLSLSLSQLPRALLLRRSRSLFLSSRRESVILLSVQNALSFASVYTFQSDLSRQKGAVFESLSLFSAWVLRVWSLLIKNENFFFFYFCVSFGGARRNRLVFFSLFVVQQLSFCLLVCLVFLALLGVKKRSKRRRATTKGSLCSTREKKRRRERERERDKARGQYIYIYIYESERRSGVFGAPRAHPRRRRRRMRE